MSWSVRPMLRSKPFVRCSKRAGGLADGPKIEGDEPDGRSHVLERAIEAQIAELREMYTQAGWPVS